MIDSTDKPAICFVAPNAYAALSGRHDLGHIGGSEVQQVMIARELASRGFPVTFVTSDHGQADGIEHDGIRVFKTCGVSDGWPVIRFLHPRWTSLNRAMSCAGADVYYQRNAGAETGQVAWWSRIRRKRFIFAAASDTDCDRKLPYLRTSRERMLFRYGIRRAARIVAQTESQVRRFRSDFGVESILIRSCTRDPAGSSRAEQADRQTGRSRILWVGRFAREKRPEMLLDLAAMCPEFDFHVVGAASGVSPYSDALLGRARGLPNVTVHGRVPHEEVGRYYDRMALLLCTSAWEGYPNTFMEAWMRNMPTVSTVDPDQVVAKNGLGGISETVEGLRHAIVALVESKSHWQACGRRAREFVVRNHGVAGAGDAYEQVIDDVLGRRVDQPDGMNVVYTEGG